MSCYPKTQRSDHDGISLSASSKQLLNGISQSIRSNDNSLLGDWCVLGNVLLWNNLVLALSKAVIDVLSNGERLISKLGEVQRLVCAGWDLDTGHVILSHGTELSPSIAGEWSLDALVVGVDGGVPDGVEFISSVVILEEEVIASSVTAWFVFGVSIGVVEGLMHVTVEMNEKTEGLGLALILRFGVLHNGGVGEGARVRLTIKPVIQLRHDS